MSEDHGERLARIETKVDLVLDSIKSIEGRTSAVEKKQWIHTGALVVLAPLLAKYGIHLPS